MRVRLGSIVTTLVLASLMILAFGCAKKVTKAECARIVDKFIDLKLQENPRYESLPPTLKATVRAAVKQESDQDPDVQQATEHCEDEITREEFDCANKAKSSREWNACIN
jgi:hypothetical protein